MRFDCYALVDDISGERQRTRWFVEELSWPKCCGADGGGEETRSVCVQLPAVNTGETQIEPILLRVERSLYRLTNLLSIPEEPFVILIKGISYNSITHSKLEPNTIMDTQSSISLIRREYNFERQKNFALFDQSATFIFITSTCRLDEYCSMRVINLFHRHQSQGFQTLSSALRPCHLPRGIFGKNGRIVFQNNRLISTDGSFVFCYISPTNVTGIKILEVKTKVILK